MNLSYNILATKGQRFLTFVIDRICLYIILALLGLILGLIAYFTGDYSWISWVENIDKISDFILTNTIFLFYYFIFELINGRTLGKIITGTKVISRNRKELSASQILIRTMSRIIPFEPFSFFGDRVIGWHDSFADTVVVDVKKYNNAIKLKNSLNQIGKN